MRRSFAGWYYRLGMLFGVSAPGAGLPAGGGIVVLPVSGDVVGGEADGTRSPLGLSPTRPL